MAQSALVASSVVTYWLLMMPFHELGHVLHAFATGGHVVRVVLHPLAFSRTDVSPNPAPLAVVCGGPLWGSALPVLLWLVWRTLRLPAAKWLQGLAGFCLIANGLYIASAIIIPAGDTEDLIRLGAPAWLLLLTGLAPAIAGFWLIHRLGPACGTRALTPPELRRSACIAAIGLAITIACMAIYASLTPAAAPPAASPSP